MKSTHRKWLTATAATVGAGALAFGGAVLPAAAEESPADDSFSTIEVETDKYELAAQRTGETVDELKQGERIGDIKVSERGFVLHVTPEAESAPLATMDAPESSGAAIPGNPVDGSRPDAPLTIYLDFDGETLAGTHWNTDSEIASLDFGPAAIATQAEEVWAGVAEDYAPFDVNVTTTEPSDDALYKTSADDNEYGVHVIITDSYDETLPDAAGTSGLAWLDAVGSDYLTGALVFTTGVGGGDPVNATARSVADTASHEAGHNFGLEHAGHTSDEYYYPTDGVWGPLMGATYEVPLSQWTDRTYEGAIHEQDDLATITDRSAGGEMFVAWLNADGEAFEGGNACFGNPDMDPENPQPGDSIFPVDASGECGDVEYFATFTYTDRADYATDEVGNTPADAAALDNADGTFADKGVIVTSDDVDVFSVTTIGGPVSATVEVADLHPNLDAKLTLTNEAGDVLAEDNPDTVRDSAGVASGLGAEVSADVEAGTYYLAVEGVGFGDPSTATPENAGGYSDYGSLGNYTLTGEAAPFEADPIVIETPADGSEVTGGSDVEVTGTATAGAEISLTVDGEVVATATADDSGAWTATVTANDYGDTAVEASQSVDGIDVPETASVTVTAPVEAPAIQNPADGSTTDDTSPTVTGTGIPGAEVTLVVDGVEYTATVDADGNWEVTTDVLADGEYTATATQTINGVTSDESVAVAFTVEAPDDGTDGSTDGTDGTTDTDGTDGSTDGTDGSTDGTDGSTDGTDDTDTDLAVTGGDFNVTPFVLLAAGLLVIGAGTAAFAIRQRKLSMNS
ncbi:zinc-dependent metalloprotease family protein [Microbacterium sp.]|uniref:zinc-dependent metalloprotease family protein n=1 Tax=Microbacterium sp. TaxID=51671 RepID=UPI003F9E77AF